MTAHAETPTSSLRHALSILRQQIPIRDDESSKRSATCWQAIDAELDRLDSPTPSIGIEDRLAEALTRLASLEQALGDQDLTNPSCQQVAHDIFELSVAQVLFDYGVGLTVQVKYPKNPAVRKSGEAGHGPVAST
jgi:hypothetical protein